MKNSRELIVNVGDYLFALYPISSRVEVTAVEQDRIKVKYKEDKQYWYQYQDFGQVLFLCEKDYAEAKTKKPLQDIRYTIFRAKTYEERHSLIKSTEDKWSQMSYYDYEFLHENQYFSQVIFEVEKNLKKAKQYLDSLKYYGEVATDKNWSGFIPTAEREDPCNDYTLQLKIRDEPYFAKVNCQSTGEFYLGKNSIGDYVNDWRDTEKANLYYNYNILAGREDVGLLLVRDFVISNTLKNFSDRYNRIKGIQKIGKQESDSIIYDEFLIKILEKNRLESGIHDIIQSIRTEQYDIITQKPKIDLVVSGCAGSGKTMIMIHRISFLAYNFPEVNSTNTFIISPNTLLNKEATTLAKDLGLDNYMLSSATELFGRIIGEYALPGNTYAPPQKFISNWKIPLATVNNMYNPHFIEEYLACIDRICTDANSSTYGSNIMGKNSSYKTKESERLAEEFKRIGNISSNQNDLHGVLTSNSMLVNMAKEYKEILNNLAKENVGARLFGENRAISVQNKSLKSLIEQEKDLNKKRKLQDEFDMLLHYYENSMLSGKAIYVTVKQNSLLFGKQFSLLFCNKLKYLFPIC